MKTGTSIIILLLIICPLIRGEGLKEQLEKKARENIELLHESKKNDLCNLMDNYSDVLIYFLIASEDPYKLEIADASVIESHYRHIKEHHWSLYEKEYRPEFFLSYIAKITVTDELITPYRQEFCADGLGIIADSFCSLYDRAVAVNLWCRERMTFQPTSGRDQDPLSVLRRSNLGRCEEMQIFYIAAARSAGIPARPASTPLWAHTDNNHAWVEVYANNRWHYLGAAEPDYTLDRAWFTQNLDKVLLVTARSVYPDSTDIELFKSDNNYFINSTPNYADTRKIKIQAINRDHEPVKDAEFLINVFNWGMLRPILRLKTGANDSVTLDTGAGSFIVTASNDGLYGLIEIPAGEADAEYEMELSPEIKENQFILHYPGVRSGKDEEKAPEGWNKRMEKSSENYSKAVSAYQETAIDFAEHSPILEAVWKRFRNNKAVFRNFYLQYEPEDTYLQYLGLIDEKFLWQCSEEQITSHYMLYCDLKSSDTYSEEEQIANILEPGVFYEELPGSRLKPELLQWREKDADKRTFLISRYLEDHYIIEPDRSLQGLLPVDLLMDRRYLTENQYKILLVFTLRQNFIPSLFSRNPGTVIIYSNNQWMDFDFNMHEFVLQAGESAGVPVKISYVDGDGQPLKPAEGQYTFTILRDGQFFPFQADAKFEGYVLNTELPRELYYLHTGYRVSDDETRVCLARLDTRDRDEISKKIILTRYPISWDNLTEEFFILKDIAEPLIKDPGADYIFLFGNHDREMVQRLAMKILSSCPQREFCWIGAMNFPEAPGNYLADKKYGDLLESNANFNNMIITLYYQSEEKSWQFYLGIWESLPGLNSP